MNYIYSPLEQFDPTYINISYMFFWLSNYFLILFLLLFIVILFFITFTNNYFNSITLNTFISNFLSFYNNIVKTELGGKNQNFFNFFFNLFLFLLFCNFFGMLAFGFTITSHISVTYTLASIVFFGIIFWGFFLHGLGFFKILVPSGAPKALLPFLVVIEFISFISRVLSLSIRLFANMMSGHTLLYIIANFCVFVFTYFGIFFIMPVGFLIFILICLEFFIAALQAYVFTVLSIIYIKDAFNGSH